MHDIPSSWLIIMIIFFSFGMHSTLGTHVFQKSPVESCLMNIGMWKAKWTKLIVKITTVVVVLNYLLSLYTYTLQHSRCAITPTFNCAFEIDEFIFERNSICKTQRMFKETSSSSITYSSSIIHFCMADAHWTFFMIEKWTWGKRE